MAYTNAWDETAPAGTDAIAAGDDEIRQFKLDIRERLNSLLHGAAALAQDLDPLVLAASVTQGDGTAEDCIYIINGNAQDFYFGLDDSVDDFIIGVGNTMGTTPAIIIDENALVRFGAAGTQDGQAHILSGSTSRIGLVVEMPATPSVNAQEWHYNGVGGGSTPFINLTAAITRIATGSRDLGDDLAGPEVQIGRNLNSTNPNAGSLAFVDLAGSKRFYWADSTGDLRYNTVPPSAAVADTDGVVVGTQSSPLRDLDTGELLKNLGELATPEEGLANVLKTQYYHYTYVNGRYNKSEFVGSYSEISPHLMMDKGRTFSPVNATSFNSLAIQALHARIEALERRVN